MTDDEHRKISQYAIDNAVGSARAEGVEPDEFTLGLLEQMKNGELSVNEAIALQVERFKK